MMCLGVVLVDLTKDGRRVLEHLRLPGEQAACPAPYRGGERKLCSRKDANRRIDVFRRSKPARPGIKGMGSEFLANSGRT